MDRMRIATLFRRPGRVLDGKDVVVCRWARTIRGYEGLRLYRASNDGSCFKNLQVVMDAERPGATIRRSPAQNVGAALIVTGTVVLHP